MGSAAPCFTHSRAELHGSDNRTRTRVRVHVLVLDRLHFDSFRVPLAARSRMNDDLRDNKTE